MSNSALGDNIRTSKVKIRLKGYIMSRLRLELLLKVSRALSLKILIVKNLRSHRTRNLYDIFPMKLQLDFTNVL